MVVVIGIVAGLAVGAGVAFLSLYAFAGSRLAAARRTRQLLVTEAKREADSMRREAQSESDALRREGQIEAREASVRMRAEIEQEVAERRADLLKIEERVLAKEEDIDRKLTELTRREQGVSDREAHTRQLQDELKEARDSQLTELERVSGMTVNEAKTHLLERSEELVRHELARRVRQAEEEARGEAKRRARNLVADALQRVAANHASETTVSLIELPSDDMKGRIIGREGRNIRALEHLTGVDVIIDDTPQAVVLSSFDGIRREVAKLTLSKLIEDGRIHPARIEEIVAKSKQEIEQEIREEGDAAAYQAGVPGLHPEIIKVVGRLKFRTSYGQNQLQHAVEASHIAAMLASEVGADVTVVRRAAFLHDIGKVLTHEVEGPHHIIGADFIRRFGEPKAVVQAACEMARELLITDRTLAPPGEGLKYYNSAGVQTGYDKTDRRAVLSHSAEVARLAGIMAKEVGLDAHVTVRAAFLHDIGKAIDREMEGTHLQLGIDFLRKHGESEAVVMAMAAHHMDIDWPSLEAMIVQAADAISAARPGARRDILESYVKRLEKLEGIADSFKGVSKSFALQAGREIRIMVESEKITDEEAVWLSKDIARRIENELEYPGQIKVTVIRETRAVDYAK